MPSAVYDAWRWSPHVLDAVADVADGFVSSPMISARSCAFDFGAVRPAREGCGAAVDAGAGAAASVAGGVGAGARVCGA